ncbi:MAG: protein kinase domain-containing protein [Terriglobales bacterium]
MPTIADRYELFERLGAGGMGEVFRARDTKLNRSVALKFLPMGASEAARERFQREAQAIATLNHPHICVLHESGEDNGRPFLVLELLEGETLQARLARGPLAGDVLLEAALEITEALDAAHKRGILHRDLKPANIWVLPGGHIKVLDFGLARLTNEALSEAATVAGEAALLTSPGMAVGTAPYMSPEQAKGEPLDARSDIFSFGAVLYEMATGRAAFARPSSAATASAVLTEQPPLMDHLPPELNRIVARCLEKDPDLRYQTANDVRIELKRLKRASSSSATATSTVAAAPLLVHPTSAWRWIALAVVIVIAAGLAWWRLAARSTPLAPPTLSFRQLTFSGDVADAAISPDGRFLAEVHIDPAGTSLHLLSIANGSDVQIVPPGNGCCQDPAIAPDDSAVYFVANHTLESVPVLGGAVHTIATPVCSGAGLAPDGSEIAYITRFGTTLTRLMGAKPDGSQAHVIAQSEPGTDYDGLCWTDFLNPAGPEWSPDGRRIAVAIGTQAGNGQPAIGVVPSDGGKAVLIAPGVFPGFANLAWLPGGRVLVASTSSAAGEPLQVWRFAWPGGERAQLTSDLQGYAHLTASSTGDLALLHSEPQASIWLQPKRGAPFTQLPGGGADLDGGSGLAWTPEGKLVTTRRYGIHSQLWTENDDGSDAHALALTGVPNGVFGPTVTPDGQMLFNASEQGRYRIWRANADGSHAVALTAPNGAAAQLALIHNGAAIVYLSIDGKGNQTLWQVPVAGGVPRPFWGKGFVGFNANAASPDGKQLLEASRPGDVLLELSADGAITVKPAGLDPKTMLGRYGWTPDGRAITYIHRQGSVDNIWAFPLNGGKPYALTHFTSLSISSYAFSRDGRLAISRGSANTDVVLATGLGGKH